MQKPKPPDKSKVLFQKVRRLENLCDHTKAALEHYQKALQEARAELARIVSE